MQTAFGLSAASFAIPPPFPCRRDLAPRRRQKFHCRPGLHADPDKIIAAVAAAKRERRLWLW